MLIREVLRLLAVVLRGAVARLIEHQVPVGEAVVMHVRGGELLLVLVDLVQLRAHLAVGVASAHLAAEDVASLSRCSLRSLLIASHAAARAARTSSRPLSLDLCDHLHLIWILHHKLPCIASVGRADAA